MNCLSCQNIGTIANKLNVQYDKLEYDTKNMTRTKSNELALIIQKHLNKINNIHSKVNPGSNLTEALHENDIYNIMKYFQKSDKKFSFLGPFPVDFPDIYEGLVDMDWDKLSKQKNKLAIIWNVKLSNDLHHWVAVFIEFQNNDVCYFDSLANFPDNNISEFFNKITTKIPNVTIFRNVSPFQNENENCCGLLIILFIISRLKGVTCNEFCTQNIDNLKNEITNIKKNNYIYNPQK